MVSPCRPAAGARPAAATTCSATAAQAIGHGGDAYGVRSGLWIDPRRGIGIAFFATGNGDDPPRGRSAYRAIEEALARHLRR